MYALSANFVQVQGLPVLTICWYSMQTGFAALQTLCKT